MPSKSRHRQRKISQSKKRRSMSVSPPLATQQPVEAQPSRPVAPPKVAAHSVRTPIPTSARYPYIVTELKSIGILTGIILVILVVLFLVLS